MEIISKILEYEFFKVGDYSLNLWVIISVLFIITITKLVLLVIRKLLFRAKNLDIVDESNLISLFQIIKYIVWIISIMIILDTFGFELNALLAGSAALLVGVGLGLQSTFNDFISGIILLFEGSVKVGDILELDHDVVKIQRIGMRTSEALNRDDIISIIPNSLITSNKVINWSHQSKKTRFTIKVGVAYGSDVELVMKLLKKSVAEHTEINTKESIIVRFIDFGNSSLDFELLFFSYDIFRIENVKSDIRKTIYKLFNENNVTIPFTQMDLHLKSGFYKDVDKS